MFWTAVATSRPSSATSSISSSRTRRPLARERDHPDRPRAEQQRRDELAAEAERDQQLVLRVLVLGSGRGGRRSARRSTCSSTEPRERADVAGGKTLVRAATRGRHRRRACRPRRGRSPSASNGTSPRSSRMKAPKASLELERRSRARAAQRFAASSTSTRRPSSSRSRSASAARSAAVAPLAASRRAASRRRRRRARRRGRAPSTPCQSPGPEVASTDDSSQPDHDRRRRATPPTRPKRSARRPRPGSGRARGTALRPGTRRREMKPIATMPSKTNASARARRRPRRPSSTAASAPETAVPTAKNADDAPTPTAGRRTGSPVSDDRRRPRRRRAPRARSDEPALAARSGTAPLRACRSSAQRGVLAQRVVAVLEARLDGAPLRAADVAERDERVPPQAAAVVARHVEALVAAAQLVRVGASQSTSETCGSAPRGSGSPARRFSIPRFHGHTSWQMSQP